MATDAKKSPPQIMINPGPCADCERGVAKRCKTPNGWICDECLYTSSPKKILHANSLYSPPELTHYFNVEDPTTIHYWIETDRLQTSFEKSGINIFYGDHLMNQVQNSRFLETRIEPNVVFYDLEGNKRKID